MRRQLAWFLFFASAFVSSLQFAWADPPATIMGMRVDAAIQAFPDPGAQIMIARTGSALPRRRGLGGASRRQFSVSLSSSCSPLRNEHAEQF